MAINISVQYNRGLLPDIILLTHFAAYIPSKRDVIFSSLTGGCSEGLDAFNFLF